MEVDVVSLSKLHKNYIKSSEKEAPVIIKTILLCNLTFAVEKTGLFKSSKVHINTIVLKHLYDKRTAQEYEFLVANILHIIKYPDHIYENKSGKRGNIIFVKKFKKYSYLCITEIILFTHPNGDTEEINHLTTAFRTDEDYLKGFKLLWSWKDGKPSS